MRIWVSIDATLKHNAKYENAPLAQSHNMEYDRSMSAPKRLTAYSPQYLAAMEYLIEGKRITYTFPTENITKRQRLLWYGFRKALSEATDNKYHTRALDICVAMKGCALTVSLGMDSEASEEFEKAAAVALIS